MNIQIDKFIYRSDLETTILASFPAKSLNHTAINFFPQNMSTLTNAKFTTSLWTDFTLQASVKKLRAIETCSAFTPRCGCDNSTNTLIGDVFFQLHSLRVNFAWQNKKTFESLHRSDYHSPQWASLGKVRKFFLRIKQIPFFRRLTMEFTFLNRVQNQFKTLLEMSIFLASILSRKEKWISWQLCNNSGMALWSWKKWSLASFSQSSF